MLKNWKLDNTVKICSLSTSYLPDFCQQVGRAISQAAMKGIWQFIRYEPKF